MEKRKIYFSELLIVSVLFQTLGNCILTIDTSTSFYVNSGWYAVAITIEDFPTAPMTIGSQNFGVNDPISSIPVQVFSSLIMINLYLEIRIKFWGKYTKAVNMENLLWGFAYALSIFR